MLPRGPRRPRGGSQCGTNLKSEQITYARLVSKAVVGARCGNRKCPETSSNAAAQAEVETCSGECHALNRRSRATVMARVRNAAPEGGEEVESNGPVSACFAHAYRCGKVVCCGAVGGGGGGGAGKVAVHKQSALDAAEVYARDERCPRPHTIQMNQQAFEMPTSFARKRCRSIEKSPARYEVRGSVTVSRHSAWFCHATRVAGKCLAMSAPPALRVHGAPMV